VTALSADARAKLAKTMAMLGSAHQGERAAAAEAAHRLVMAAGATWGDVLTQTHQPDYGTTAYFRGFREGIISAGATSRAREAAAYRDGYEAGKAAAPAFAEAAALEAAFARGVEFGRRLRDRDENNNRTNPEPVQPASATAARKSKRRAGGRA
jgi:hypothetical protein